MKSDTLRKTIECVCGGEHRFADLEKIIIQHYREPYGCTGGDYWYDGEWNYVCPVKNKRVRILFCGNAELNIDWEAAQKLEARFHRLYRNAWKAEKRVEHEESFVSVPGRDFFNNHAIEMDPVGYGLARYVTTRQLSIGA